MKFLSAGQSFAFLLITICTTTNGLEHNVKQYRHVADKGLKPATRGYRSMATNGLTPSSAYVRSEITAGIIVECDTPWIGGGRVTLNETQDRTITQDMFQTFSACEQLELIDLSISDISDNAFSSMRKLDYLRIEGNHFGSVRRAMFNGMVSEVVKYFQLHMPDNRILFIQSQSFADIKSLTNLDLRRNPLTGPMTPDTFRINNQGNIFLGLSYTGVVIEQGLFQHIPNLEGLFIDGTPFKFTPNVWKGLKLTHLSIEHANITELKREQWEGLGNSLKYLFLDGNT